MFKNWLRPGIAATAIVLVGLLSACNGPEFTPAPPTPTTLEVDLICAPPDKSTLQYGETATLRVAGTGTFTYKWEAVYGAVNPPGAQATIYTAPSTSGADVVSVTVSDGSQSVVLSCTYQITPPPPPPPTPITIGFQKGVALPVWWFEHYCQPEFGLIAIQDITELGADWVQLVPTWYQEDRIANEIKPLEDKTTTDDCLIRAIEAAHNAGLGVMLKPHVDSLDGYYRGEIAPSQPADWFASYEEMILHYADIAWENDVEILVVGTELKSMSEKAYTGQWRELIDQVRQRYFNWLTYAANWDDYDQIEFWDALDYVGIDAYFPLADLDDPSREEILAGWQSYPGPLVTRHWAKEVKALQAAVGKPLLFTEIGYASQDGAARQPWRQDHSQQPNPELQARLYEAALRTFWTQPDFKGFYWWFWDVQPDPLFKETGYMPKSPALQELQCWYQLSPPTMPPPPPDTPTPTFTPTLTPPTNTPIPVITPILTPPTDTPTPTFTPTFTPSPMLPPATAPGWTWESCTGEKWVAQTYEDSRGIESVAGSGDVARTGSCSLKLNARLQAQHPNFSKAEAYVELSAPRSFDGVAISCWVYVPDNATGPQSSFNGAQLFVKDTSYKSEYGSWLNLDRPGWIQITLTPTTSAPPNGGYMDAGFDPNAVKMLGVKIAVNDQSPADYSYNGPFYVDDCTW